MEMKYPKRHNNILRAVVSQVIRMYKMKFISKKSGNEYLSSIGMKIRDWNQISDIDSVHSRNKFWVNYPAPQSIQELLNFSQHVAGWLPRGKWKILQIDNSTNLDVVQENFLGRLIFGPRHTTGLNGESTFVFEFGNDQGEDKNAELLISDLIFSFFIFSSHVYFVSSFSNNGERLGVQDGFSYFSARDENISGAMDVIVNFERCPLISPQWIIDINSGI